MRWLAWLLVVACGSSAPREASDACKQVAQDFGAALVAHDFARASALTTARYRATTSTAQLEAAFVALTAPIGALGAAQVMNTMADWPARQAGDVGWAYVALPGTGDSEGMTLVIARDAGALRVRDVAWGRP